MPGFTPLNEGDECEIVEINGDYSKFTGLGKGVLFSKGPFITVTFVSYGNTMSTSHGDTPRAIVMRDGKNITQEDKHGMASFFFVVKGGQSASSGGRKSRRRKSNKNKRTRRKSVKKHHHRRK